MGQIITKKITPLKICWIIALILLGCWAWWWIMHSVFLPSSTQEETMHTQTHTQEWIEENAQEPINSSAIDVSNLTAIYHQNEVAADQRFKGKRLKIIGFVDEIRKDFLDTPIVELGVYDHPLMSTRCEFNKTDEDVLSRLQKGMRITIIGTCRGMVLGSVSLRHCTIIPSSNGSKTQPTETEGEKIAREDGELKAPR